MDPPAFGSLAHIRVLLLPVGNIRKETYEKWALEIRSFESIPLGDIPSDTRDERARFMPSPLANGHLHLSYPTHPPPLSHNSLSLFRPSSFPLGVIGISSCSRSDSMSSILTAFSKATSRLSSRGSTFPVAQTCFVFEEDDANLDVGDRFPGLVVIPGMMGNKRVHIGTLLAGLCSQILGEFAGLMQTLESPLGNEYLNSTLFPTLPPTSELPRSLQQEIEPRDAVPPLPSRNSQPDLNSSNGARARTPLSLKCISTGTGVGPIRHASLPATPVPAKKRPSAIGVASSHGRLFKVLGDLFLLSGRHQDATVWYTEAVALFKGQQDFAWHASALEGLATILVVEAWPTGNGTTGPIGDKEPWQDPADKLTQAISLYHRSTAPSDPESMYPLLAYLYAQCVLRHTNLLFSIWCSKGWGPMSFSQMLHPTPDPYLPLNAASNGNEPSSTTVKKSRKTMSYADMERLTTITGISRVQIGNTLGQVHGPWLLHLGARERISVLGTVAGLYGALGYLRKEAYILRELLGSIMDLIVCGRDEGTARTTNGLGIRGSPSGGKAASQGTVGIRENQRIDGNESVLRIIKHICKVHGVDLEAVKLIDIDSFNIRKPSDELVAVDDTAEPESEPLESYQEPFGWPELQIGIVREAIAVAEALPDYPSVAQFSCSSLKMLHPVMSQSDQFHLYHTATRALTTAIRRGDRRTVEYWAGRPVVSIEVLPLPLIRLPIEKPISILALPNVESDLNPILTGVKDPFLYNPRKLISGQDQTILVQNERFEVVVTLRNPFVFDLQLESMALSTSGTQLESEPIPVIIPANTYHPVTMSGKALAAGTLVIRGCIVQAPGGVPREYALPLSTDEEEERRLRRRSAIESEAGRSKHSGLEARPWEKAGKRISRQAAGASNSSPVHHLICKVVPEQPLLRIRRTSLTHGAVMLYDGETSSVRLTLENVSTLPVDFLRLTFDDSTVAPAQQALAEGELSVFETYETEYRLTHRSVFQWDAAREKHRVDPGEKATVTVNCFGKVGCTSGAIHVSYAYLHRDRDETATESKADVFHTRQLSYPVVVTVYHMLECHSMDILPYTSITSFSASASSDGDTDIRKQVLNVDNVADWCLFSIDVRNTYGLPFEVTFERHESEYASTTCLVAPGSTSRLIIPIKKMLLSKEHVSRSIPTLSDRQFVVTKSNLTSAEEQAQRELFWYREELFRVVSGRWKESGGTRSGELSLRQQRLTLPMLETLRTETARVQMSLLSYDENQISKPVGINATGSKFLPLPNEFVYLRTTVTNLSLSEMVLTLSLSLEPAQHMLYQGVLNDIPVGRLGPGESQATETPVAFVSGGRFSCSAYVYALHPPEYKGQVGRGNLVAVVEAGLT